MRPAPVHLRVTITLVTADPGSHSVRSSIPKQNVRLSFSRPTTASMYFSNREYHSGPRRSLPALVPISGREAHHRAVRRYWYPGMAPNPCTCCRKTSASSFLLGRKSRMDWNCRKPRCQHPLRVLRSTPLSQTGLRRLASVLAASRRASRRCRHLARVS